MCTNLKYLLRLLPNSCRIPRSTKSFRSLRAVRLATFVYAYTHRIQKYTSDGVFITEWDISDASVMEAVVEADSAGNVYIGGDGNIQKFTDSGQLLLQWPISTYGANCVAGITVDSSGNVYVVSYQSWGGGIVGRYLQKYTNSDGF